MKEKVKYGYELTLFLNSFNVRDELEDATTETENYESLADAEKQLDYWQNRIGEKIFESADSYEVLEEVILSEEPKKHVYFVYD